MRAIEEVLTCPKCKEAMEFKEPGFWKCPLCAGEFWEDEEDEPEEVQIWKCYLDSLVILTKKRSRGGRGGRKDTKLLRKPWMTY